MRLENSELRTFQAVVEANGFNRAAERLHISQSAVSQAIASLEAKLDTPLLFRGKQLGLSEAGRRLLEHANETLREEQLVLEDIGRIKRGGQQTLNIAINSSITRFYAPQLISQFSLAQQDTHIKVAQLPSRRLIYEVLSGRAELAIGPFQKHMDAFTTIPLFNETRHLVVSSKHAHFQQLLKGEHKSLKQSPLITSFLDNPEMRPAIQRIRDRFKSVWEISSLSLRIHLVEQGLGVAFINHKLLAEDPVCQQFTTLKDLPFGRIDRQAGIYYKAGKTLSPSAQEFVALCREFW